MSTKIEKQDGFYTVADLLGIKDDPNRWIVKNMIPKVGKSIVFGRGGTYKSSLMFDLSVAVASGGHMLEQFPVMNYGPVLVISTEGSIYDNKERLLGHMRSRNVFPTVVQLHFRQRRLRLDKPDGIFELEKKIVDIRPALVVLDPYVSFFGGYENRAHEVGAMLANLDYLVEKHDMSMVVIHHANKEGDLRGSTALWGWADSILGVTVQRKVAIPGLPAGADVVTVESKKQRNGPEGHLFSAVPMYNERLGMITFGVHAGQDAQGVLIAYLKQAIVQLLHEAPPGSSYTRTELAEQFRVGNDRVLQALLWLQRDGLVSKVSASRATNKDGSRGRQVEAWTSNGPGRVDAYRAMVDVKRMEAEAENDITSQPSGVRSA